jgi:hypothetical protein
MTFAITAVAIFAASIAASLLWRGRTPQQEPSNSATAAATLQRSAIESQPANQAREREAVGLAGQTGAPRAPAPAASSTPSTAVSSAPPSALPSPPASNPSRRSPASSSPAPQTTPAAARAVAPALTASDPVATTPPPGAPPPGALPAVAPAPGTPPPPAQTTPAPPPSVTPLPVVEVPASPQPPAPPPPTAASDRRDRDSSSRTPSRTASADEDEAAIRRVTASYARAIETKDLALFRTIKPNLSREEERRLQDGFRAVTSQRVALTIVSLEHTGDEASVRIKRRDTIQAGGRPQTVDTEQTLQLTRTAAGWVILAIR